MKRPLLPSTTVQEVLDNMFFTGVDTEDIDSFEIISDVATDNDDGDTLISIRRYEDNELKDSGTWAKIVFMFAEGYWRGDTRLFSYTYTDGRVVMKNGDSGEPPESQEHVHECYECGEEFVYDENDVAYHIDEDEPDGINHDADEDHVPFDREEY